MVKFLRSLLGFKQPEDLYMFVIWQEKWFIHFEFCGEPRVAQMWYATLRHLQAIPLLEDVLDWDDLLIEMNRHSIQDYYKGVKGGEASFKLIKLEKSDERDVHNEVP